MPRFEHIDNQLLCDLPLIFDKKKSNNSTMVQLFLFTFKRWISEVKRGKKIRRTQSVMPMQVNVPPVRCELCTIILPEFIS